MKIKKIFILLLLVFVLAFGSASVAFADDFNPLFYADNTGFYYIDHFYSYSDYYSFVEDKDMVAKFQRDLPLLSNSHIVFLSKESPGSTSIKILFSPQYLTYDQYHKPGNTNWRGLFGLPSQSVYEFYVQIFHTGETYCYISTGAYNLSIGSYSSDELDESVYSEIVYSNHDILYLDTGEIFFQAPPVDPILPGEMTQGVLAPAMKEETLAETLKEVLALVPICLVCLAGFLALRKALAFLQKILQEA